MRPSIEDLPLEERLAAALANVELGTDDGRRDAGRVLVGEILSWEFGAGIRSHAEFGTMVEAIEASLAREPRLAARIGALLQDLRDRPRKPG